MLRASITDMEWKALRAAAIQADSNVQTIVGGLISEYLWANGHRLISEYLWANGHIEREETEA